MKHSLCSYLKNDHLDTVWDRSNRRSPRKARSHDLVRWRDRHCFAPSWARCARSAGLAQGHDPSGRFIVGRPTCGYSVKTYRHTALIEDGDGMGFASIQRHFNMESVRPAGECHRIAHEPQRCNQGSRLYDFHRPTPSLDLRPAHGTLVIFPPSGCNNQ